MELFFIGDQFSLKWLRPSSLLNVCFVAFDGRTSYESRFIWRLPLAFGSNLTNYNLIFKIK